MSSLSPAALPSTSPSSPPTNVPSSPFSNASTLLFGFLVSALSIFTIFMAIAIIWNRLVTRRRAMDAMLAMSSPLYPQRLCRPTIWDVWTAPDIDKQPLPLANVKPVALQECNRPPGFHQTPQTIRTMSFWKRRLLNCLPPEITYLFHPPILHSSTASNDTNIPQVGSDMQISLLICMPRHPQSKQEKRFYEIVFATTNVVYDHPGLS